MPIYEYKCPKCGTEVEVIHGMSEAPKVKCSGCRTAMKRIISANSFQLKGDGWFKTTGGYAKTGAAKAGAGAAGTTAAGTATAGAAATDTAKSGAANAAGGGKAKDGKKTKS